MAERGFTAAQRLHLDVYGYVVIERLFDRSAVDELVATLAAIEDEFRATGQLRRGVSAYWSTTREAFRIDNLVHVAPCFHRYATDRRLVAMAEEAVGGPVRLEQSDAAVYRAGHVQEHWFHRVPFLQFADTREGLYHFPFVKALTNLSDVGPEDGGTVVIAGSHKIPGPDDAIVAAAGDDPSLVHRVVAPAGSTLFFYESLLHSSGVNRSGRDRPVMIAGYTPTMFQAWGGYDPDPAFVATLPADERELLTGERRWAWTPRAVGLGAAAHAPPPEA